MTGSGSSPKPINRPPDRRGSSAKIGELTYPRGSKYFTRGVQNSGLAVSSENEVKVSMDESNRVVALRRIPLEPQLAPAMRSTENTEAAGFRPEIAALRAVAVLGV